MAKFCTYCGKALLKGERCTCKESAKAPMGIWAKLSEKLHLDKLLSKLRIRMGISDDSLESLNMYERFQNISPDNIAPHEGEIPIKQYNISVLRSRIRGQRAEGRLQVTNKRVIFRATGMSLNGRHTIQNEFQINEISGIEIRKSNRVSILNIIGGFLLTAIIMSACAPLFTDLLYQSALTANILAIVAALGAATAFLLIKRRFWLKLAINSLSLGIISAMIGVDLLTILLEKKIFTFYNTVFFVLALIWVFNMILVSLVPNLTIDVKTKSAGDAIQIRRKQWGMFFSDKKDYTGFSEVMPWVDTDNAIKELGAIVNDIQTLGDMAIDNWKNQ